ncbi:hypothetical protein [Delftia acidovorans]|uniref:hypothetical protein n=1 Tax=Delftia acidovorans TaxID=80866 RepID=UPI000552BDB1|nr:hypothetical protein [Delftia acidovorans]QQB52250.1 hypothetical protein I6H54_08335 [Delftia acidovorans]
MELKTWLTAERGRSTALSAHLSVTLGRITQMADEGVPAKYMLAVRDFSCGAVTLEEMLAPKDVRRATSSGGVAHV